MRDRYPYLRAFKDSTGGNRITGLRKDSPDSFKYLLYGTADGEHWTPMIPANLDAEFEACAKTAVSGIKHSFVVRRHQIESKSSVTIGFCCKYSDLLLGDSDELSTKLTNMMPRNTLAALGRSKLQLSDLDDMCKVTTRHLKGWIVYLIVIVLANGKWIVYIDSGTSELGAGLRLMGYEAELFISCI